MGTSVQNFSISDASHPDCHSPVRHHRTADGVEPCVWIMAGLCSWRLGMLPHLPPFAFKPAVPHPTISEPDAMLTVTVGVFSELLTSRRNIDRFCVNLSKGTKVNKFDFLYSFCFVSITTTITNTTNTTITTTTAAAAAAAAAAATTTTIITTAITTTTTINSTSTTATAVAAATTTTTTTTTTATTTAATATAATTTTLTTRPLQVHTTCEVHYLSLFFATSDLSTPSMRAVKHCAISSRLSGV